MDPNQTSPEPTVPPETAAAETPAAETLTPTPAAETTALTPPEPAAVPPAAEASPVVGWSATGSTETSTEPVTATATTGAPAPKKPTKLIALVAAGLLLIGGGSAAAYYGVVVPNKPENLLKAAVTNTLQEKQVSYKGSIDLDSGGVAVKSTFSGSNDSANKAADVNLGVTVSGVDVSLEARLVDKNIYVKMGDLSTLATMAAGFAPDYAAPATAVSKALSNKWVVIDSTLLKQAGVSCTLDADWSLTQADLKLIQTHYQQHPFTTIASHSGDTVDGKAVQKFELSLDHDKLAAFGNSLNDLSLTKAMEACQKSSAKSADIKGDHDKTPLTVWVDKSSKRIVKIGYKTTAADLKKSNLKGSGSVTLSYGKVSIKAPEGATPLLQVVASLQSSLGATGLDLTQLLTSGGGSSSNANDGKRHADISSLQTQLEAFYAQNGYYPSFAQFNSASWRKTNMKSLDETALQDPDGSSTTLATAPAAHVYSYAVTNDKGGSCEADATTCAKYELTATLADGSKYSKTSLN